MALAKGEGETKGRSAPCSAASKHSTWHLVDFPRWLLEASKICAGAESFRKAEQVVSGEKMAGGGGVSWCKSGSQSARSRSPDTSILNSPPALASPPLADFSALANLFEQATMHSITYTAHPHRFFPLTRTNLLLLVLHPTPLYLGKGTRANSCTVQYTSRDLKVLMGLMSKHVFHLLSLLFYASCDSPISEVWLDFTQL